MSRETKLGLVVAGSFLCLVGVVLFTKLREGDKPAPASEQTPEVEEVAVKSEPPKSASSGEAASTPTRQIPPPPTIVREPNPALEPVPTAQGDAVVRTRATEGAPTLDPPLPPPGSNTGGPVDPPPPSTPPAPRPQVDPPPPPVSEIPPPPPPSPPATVAGSATGGVATGREPGRSGSGETPAPPLAPPAPPGDNVAPPTLTAPTPTAGSNPTGAASAAPLTERPPASIGAPLPPTGSPAPTTGGVSISSPPPSGGQPLPPPTFNPIPPAGSSGTTPAISPPPRSAVDDAALRPAPIIPLPPASAGAAPSPASIPVGTPAGISVPPITVAGGRAPSRPIAPAPQVESFDEEEYRAKAGDTLASISMNFYRTDRYAQALLLFNRNHPLASAGVRQDPPTLQPGQSIFIPPTSILEKRHAAVISGLTPLPGASTPPPAAAPRPSNAATEPAAGLTGLAYRVPESGQMLYQIAQSTLKNGERWRDILKLNPNLRPEMPVPGGTIVLLPTDAQPMEMMGRPQ